MGDLRNVETLLVVMCAGLVWHYFPRHRFLMRR